MATSARRPRGRRTPSVGSDPITLSFTAARNTDRTYIEFRHGPPTAQGSKWSTLSAKIGREWRDLAAWALDATADDPDTVVKAGYKRFCMDRMFGFYVDDEITERWRAVLILGKTGRRIMNLIPAKSSLTSDSGYQCRKADTLPSDIIFAQMPRV
jgi:hypothetical protein